MRSLFPRVVHINQSERAVSILGLVELINLLDRAVSEWVLSDHTDNCHP